MPRLGGLAVISGFIVSVIYLLVIGTIEDNLDLFSDGYDVKLIGFFYRDGNNCCNGIYR